MRCEVREELPHLGQRHAQVGVHVKDEYRRARAASRCAPRSLFRAAPDCRSPENALVARAKLVRDLQRPIRAPLDDDQHLIRLRQTPARTPPLLQGRREAPRLIVGGNDNGEIWHIPTSRGATIYQPDRRRGQSDELTRALDFRPPSWRWRWRCGGLAGGEAGAFRRRRERLVRGSDDARRVSTTTIRRTSTGRCISTCSSSRRRCSGGTSGRCGCRWRW